MAHASQQLAAPEQPPTPTPTPCCCSYWRLFYLACSELFNYRGGEEWGVGHYVFTKEGGAAAPEQPQE